MRTAGYSLMLCFLVLHGTRARSWTNRQEQVVVADVVRVNPDRTVTMKTDSGRVVTAPFELFKPPHIAHFEFLLSWHGRPHPVTWQQLNTLFEKPIWQDDRLWDDSTAEAGQRMQMEQESRTDFMENHRTYPLGRETILSEPVYATALYGGTNDVKSLAFVFINIGDLPRNDSGGPLSEQIEACGMRIRDALTELLGEPQRDSLGREDLREKVWRWDWYEHAIMLSLQEDRYIAVRIMPIERAERGGRMDKLTGNSLKKRMAACVTRRENGDVTISNIPMINQGPKGYCSPATWERYLRYMEIPADMYLLAIAANTSAGGGTYSSAMIEATRSLISAQGRELETLDGKLDMEQVAECIDLGLPIMWRHNSTSEFREAVHTHTALRDGLEPEKKSFGSGSGGHICLIIGYNAATGEIALSDSWGPEYAERWIDLHEARRVCFGAMNVIRW